MSYMGMKHSIQLPNTTEKRGWSQQPITIFAADKDIETYKEWCKDRVGANGWNYYGKYRKKPCEFRFKRQEDLLAFKIVFGL
jgi:hypothetical protein